MAPSTWGLEAVAEQGDTWDDLYGQVAGSGWLSDPGIPEGRLPWDEVPVGTAVDITDVIPGMKSAITGTPVVRVPGDGFPRPMGDRWECENCYSFAFAFMQIPDTPRAIFTGDPNATGQVRSVTGVFTYVDVTLDVVEGMLTRDNALILTSTQVSRAHPCLGEMFGLLSPIPATQGVRAASLQTGDVLGFYAGEELVHVSVFVLRNRAGEPLVIEKPNPVDDLRVSDLSADDGRNWSGPDGEDLGPTSKMNVWRSR